MKLYYSPGACSLADHIALREAGLPFELERVDLKTKRTETGADYAAFNPRGYVPALVTDDGALVTENIAVLDYIATLAPQLGPEMPLARTRQIEALSFVSGELHKSFHPFFDRSASDDDRAAARATITRKLGIVAGEWRGDFWFGDRLSAADCYLFVMLFWASKRGIDVPGPLPAFYACMLERSSVQAAMAAEGLSA